jgi:hypothetical protein
VVFFKAVANNPRNVVSLPEFPKIKKIFGGWAKVKKIKNKKNILQHFLYNVLSRVNSGKAGARPELGV